MVSKYTLRTLVDKFPAGFFPILNRLINCRVLKTEITDSDEVIQDEIARGKWKIWYFRHSALGRNLYFRGEFEKDEIEIIRKYVKKDDVVLDIGANIGYHTIVLSDLVGTAGKVYSVEPFSKNFQLLKKNISCNSLTNVFPDKICLGEAKKETRVRIYQDYAYNSILNVSRNRSLGISETVKMDTLDNFAAAKRLNRLDFIKMDVEGYEYKILLGAAKVLDRFRPVILCEIFLENIKPMHLKVADVIKKFLKYKYKAFGIYPNAMLEQVKPTQDYSTYNFLFIPEVKNENV